MSHILFLRTQADFFEPVRQLFFFDDSTASFMHALEVIKL